MKTYYVMGKKKIDKYRKDSSFLCSILAESDTSVEKNFKPPMSLSVALLQRRLLMKLILIFYYLHHHQYSFSKNLCHEFRYI